MVKYPEDYLDIQAADLLRYQLSICTLPKYTSASLQLHTFHNSFSFSVMSSCIAEYSFSSSPFASIRPRVHSNTLSYLSNHVYARSKEMEGGVDMEWVIIQRDHYEGWKYLQHLMSDLEREKSYENHFSNQRENMRDAERCGIKT